jgi:outer membrane protein TolC
MKTRCFLALLSLTLTAAAQPEAPGKRELSLEDCVTMALQKNLNVQIERYNPQIALYNVGAAKAGYDPSLFLSGQHDNGSSSTSVAQGGQLLPGSQNDANIFGGGLSGLLPSGATYELLGNSNDKYGTSLDTNFNLVPFSRSSSSAQINITQPLLKNFWIDQTRLNIKVARNRLKYSELGLKQRVMATATSVEQAYYDLIFAREFVTVQQKAVELAEQLVRENKKRVEVGAMAPLDEKQAESQAAAHRRAE